MQISARALTAIHSLLSATQLTGSKELPKYTIDGEPISSVKELAAAMGVDTKVAAVYAISHKEFNAEAFDILVDSQTFKNLTVDQYIYKIMGMNAESKRVRLVRTVLGARRFSQPRGSIIVTDGQAPMNNIRALPNDVRGYDKVSDSKGRIFYIGEEANRWVVRSPRDHRPLFVGDSDRDAYIWLNDAVVGKKPKPPKKDDDE